MRQIIKSMKFIISYIVYLIVKIFYLEKILIKIFNKNHSMVAFSKRTFANYLVVKIFFFYYGMLYRLGDKKINRFIKTCYLANTNNGLDIAKYYFQKKREMVNNLKFSSLNKEFIWFKKNIKQILKKKNNKVCVIQIGSCSGSDLEIMRKIEPNVKYISTDISKEIINFQKTKYKNLNFDYHVANAMNLRKILNKKIYKNFYKIIFSNGSLQYLPPNNTLEMLNKLKNINNIAFLISNLSTNDFYNSNEIYNFRDNFSFQYKYEKIFTKFNFKILHQSKKKIQNSYYFLQYFEKL